MADQGGRQHLLGHPESRRLRDGFSAEKRGSSVRNSLGGVHERRARPESFNGAGFEGSLVRLRQAGENQPERQAIGLRGNREEDRAGRKLYDFFDLEREALREARSLRGSNDF